ncbi:hypothetical protein JXB37_02030 [candidate division WOR-3 bacterium]|nr:hypothetical protein [candidate division WOR-3 bacterium]
MKQLAILMALVLVALAVETGTNPVTKSGVTASLPPGSEAKSEVASDDGIMPVGVEPVDDVPFRRPLDAPDVVVIQSAGKFAALAADYQMDGTMWAAVSFRSDSACRVYKSTDHGYTWDYFAGFTFATRALMRKLQLVVGDGDSAKVIVFALHTVNTGDLQCVRWNMDGTGLAGYAVLAGPDTVTDFAACRDNVLPYYLYAVAHNGLNSTMFPPGIILRSSTFGRTWAHLDTFANLDRPHIAAGTGNHIYLSSVPNQSNWKGYVGNLISNNYGVNGSWSSAIIRPDTMPAYDVAIAPAFTSPPASAVTWLAYSHHDGADWDIFAMHSTNAGTNWLGPTTVCNVPGKDAAYLDLRNYTSPGNTYLNIGYWLGGSGDVYRQYVNAPAPTDWSDTLRISQDNRASIGISVGAALAYSPGGGSGSGALWLSSDSTKILWNAPWMTGVKETPGGMRPAPGFAVSPNPGRERFAFNWDGPAADIVLYDAAGNEIRRSRDALPGHTWDRRDNDGNRVPAGVYFARLQAPGFETARKMVLR